MAAKLTSQLFDTLRSEVGGLEVLTDPADSRFQELAKRWSDINRQIPAAIVLPDSEEQIKETVRWAAQSSVPFVIKSGGHSQWSSIGDDGFIIDLDKCAAVEVQAQRLTAKLRGSILSKQVAVHLAAAGYFAAIGNGTTIGAIPYLLNGGAAVVPSLTGYGSDQIVSARMVDAKGDLVEVTQEKEPDLLYAIRGAGQFFGLITELTIKIWPLAHLGNDVGLIWTGRFVFALDQARQVAEAMQAIMNNDQETTTGLFMLVCPPPHREPALVVAARYVGHPENARAAFGRLDDLKPKVVQGGPVPIQNVSDGREAIEAKGGFKTFGVVGLQRFDIERFLATIDVYKRLVKECPDAVNTTYNFQWDSRYAPKPAFESANSFHDIRFWQTNIIWYTSAESHKRVAELNAECIAVARGSDYAEYVDFPNATRTDPIELRFRGQARLEKLKAVKRKWDPEGVFTRQLLD